MLKYKWTSQFKKDYKKIMTSDNDIKLLEDVMQTLIKQQPLKPKHRDHILTGNYKGHRECHIKPDWLLIYRLESDTIIFVRTGKHAILFE